VLGCRVPSPSRLLKGGTPSRLKLDAVGGGGKESRAVLLSRTNCIPRVLGREGGLVRQPPVGLRAAEVTVVALSGDSRSHSKARRRDLAPGRRCHATRLWLLQPPPRLAVGAVLLRCQQRSSKPQVSRSNQVSCWIEEPLSDWRVSRSGGAGCKPGFCCAAVK